MTYLFFRINSPASSEQQNTSYFHNSSHENESKVVDSYYLQNSETRKSLQDFSNIKWSCSVCTYFNWPKSKHCVQCLTIRKSDNDCTISENEEKVKESGPIEVVTLDSVSETYLASNNVSSPIGSIANLASSKDIIPDEKRKDKWICEVSFILIFILNIPW